MNLQTPALDGFLSTFTQSVLFLFTTGLGWLTLLAAFCLFVWIRVRKALVERRLLRQTAAGGGKLPASDVVSIVFEELVAIFAKVLANVPLLVGTVAIIAALVALSAGVQNINAIVENQKRIDELSVVLRNLDKRYHVADLRSVDYAGDVSTLDVTYFDATGKPAGEPQRVRLPGNDIYFDSLVLNFDYSDIAKGRSINLALPYRVFSDKLAQAEGQKLQLRDAEGVPLVYRRDKTQVYGMVEDSWASRLKEFLAIAGDDARARTEGIVRSVYGQAVHRRILKGETFQVWIEQSGGLTIKTDAGF